MRHQLYAYNKWLLLSFPIIAGISLAATIKLPEKIDWNLILFLCLIAIYDRLSMKVFSSFNYSFFIVILGLIIFDKHSIFYGIIYITVDHFFGWFKNRSSLWVLLSTASIYIIVILIGNEFYNNLSAKTYYSRYLTLFLILILNIVFTYLYFFIDRGRITTRHFLNVFAPITFEVLLVFPLLSYFDSININLILTMLLSYNTIIGYLHTKFININDNHVKSLVNLIKQKYLVNVLFADLGNTKGLCYPNERIIVVDEKLDYPEQLQTLIHETIHIRISKKYRFPDPIAETIVVLLEAIISWYYILIAKIDSTVSPEKEIL